MHANVLALLLLSVTADPTLIHVTDGNGAGVTDAVVELCPDAQFRRDVVVAAHTANGVYKVTAAELAAFGKSIHFRASLESGASKEGKPVNKVQGSDWPPPKLAVTLLREPITYRPPGIAPPGQLYVLAGVNFRHDEANSRIVHIPQWLLVPTAVNSSAYQPSWVAYAAAPVTVYYAPTVRQTTCYCPSWP